MKDFEDNPISTMTIVATLNCKLDVGRIFRMLPITHYEPPIKTRGRKKKDQPPIPETKLKPGSIVSAKYREEHRGAMLKKIKVRTDGSKKYFRNQTTIVLVLEEKWINIKIFSGEKTNCAVFHLTGCKNQNQCERGILYLWRYIQLMGQGMSEKELQYTIESREEMVLTEDGDLYYDQVPVFVPEDDKKGPVFREFINNEPLTIVLDIVMINTDYHLGFQIDRKKLNNLMNHFNEIVSAFEPAGDTGVNTRMYYDTPEECIVDAMVWNDKDEDFDIVEMDKFEFYRTLPKKKKQPDRKHHTFLIFRKGKVIQSGCYYPLMKHAYDTFMKIVNQNAHQLMEELSSTKREEVMAPSLTPTSTPRLPTRTRIIREDGRRVIRRRIIRRRVPINSERTH